MQLISVLILICLDAASPDVAWERIIDVGSSDKAHGLAFSPGEDAFVVAGEVGDIPQDILIYKLSMSNGDSIWVKTVDNAGAEDIGTDVAIASNGDVFVGGTTKIGSDPKVYLTLYSKTGNVSWGKNILFSGENGKPSLACHDEDSCYLANWYVSGSNLHTNVLLVDRDGGVLSLWDAATPSSYALSGVDIDTEGNVYSCASEKGGIILDKMKGDGTYYWDKSYTETSVTLKGWACRVAPTQEIFLCGEWTKTNTDALLLKWDTSGLLLFSPAKHYDLGYNEYCRDLAVDAISDCYLAGWQQRGEEEDLMIIKTDSSGNLLWSWVDTLPGKQEVEAIEIDPQGYLYLAGSTQTGTDWNALVMKVRQPLSISGIVKDSTGKVMKNFTMALSGDTTLEVTTDNEGRYSLVVYNGGNYTLKPKQSGWVFEPSQYSYSPLAHRMANQDFSNGRWTGITEQPLPTLPSIEISNSTIHYTLGEGRQGIISIFDASGRKVESQPVTGSGEVRFKAGLVTGVYFVKLGTEKISITKKTVVLR